MQCWNSRSVQNQFLGLRYCTAPSGTALCWSSYHVNSLHWIFFRFSLVAPPPPWKMNLLLQNELGSFILSILQRVCLVLSRQQAGLHRTFKPYMDQFIFEIASLCLKHSSIIAFLSVWQKGGLCSVDGIFPLWPAPRSTHCNNTHLWCQAWSLDASKTFFARCVSKLLRHRELAQAVTLSRAAVVHTQRASVLLNPNIALSIWLLI